MSSWILTAMTFLPVAAAGALYAFKPTQVRWIRIASLAASLLVAALAAVAAFSFDATRGGESQFDVSWAWIGGPGPGFEIRYAMGVDGISLAMIVLTALLVPLCVAASWSSIQDRPRGFFTALLLLESSMIGVFCARDLFLFYVFWEAMLIPMALIIGIWGGPRRVMASVKFFLYTMAGSVLMLIAILYLFSVSGSESFEMEKIFAGLRAHPLPASAQKWLFLAFASAFAIKVPLFPFHTWLPDAHVEAPTAGSVILAGVLLKMGAYGFIRFAIPLFPAGAAWAAPGIVALAVIGIVFGALMSMVQVDIKKLIAYSSVSHLGFVVLGIFSFTPQGLQGAVLQMVNHGLSTGALFLLVGVVYERTHKRGVDDFGGLARVTPRYAALFLLVTLSSIGLPGLNGFVGEFLVLMGAFIARPAAAAVAATGVILGAVYMLRLYRDVFFGKPKTAKLEQLEDLTPVEMGYLAPLAILIVLLGVLPAIVLKASSGASQAILTMAGGSP